MRAAISSVGRHIVRYGVPASVAPFVFVFTGRGNVSTGAQEIFRELPHEFVSADELPDVVRSGGACAAC